ncbi:helix-turn-helix domain-containing protein [Sharpea azabuensis]|uniref:helix-turn-helix domain-containing protein n=1 Tax=Sharpea azabuensis TaxID=322505 RepID=UPI0008E64FE9|nr:helix-turn-helix domain-containing protein [Sharpea azabuensis]SFE17109.1 Helix-turn-helix domain-containing protein [Sharpea azabuensis]
MNYNHININERSCIYQFLTLGMSIRGIAKALHRSPSTISREIKRNSYRTRNNFKEHDRYFPVKAQEKYEERRTRCHRPARYQEQEIHYIKEKIENHWSPEQLVNRAKMEKIKTPSTATVYRMIHRGVIPKTKMEHLRRKGRFKRPAETRGKFNDGGRTIKKIS